MKAQKRIHNLFKILFLLERNIHVIFEFGSRLVITAVTSAKHINSRRGLLDLLNGLLHNLFFSSTA